MSDSPNAVMIDETTAVLGGAQYKERMLCDACEQRVGRWERYASKITVQSDGAFPAREHARRIELAAGDWHVAELPDGDPDALTRFAVSVVWRASVSAFFAKVRLGPYEGPLREYLLSDGAALPERTRLLVELVQPRQPRQPRISHAVIAPVSSNEDGYHLHHFAAFGIWFQLAVGGCLPRGFDEICHARTRRVVLSSGQRLLDVVADHVDRVTPRGSLARRRPVTRQHHEEL